MKTKQEICVPILNEEELQQAKDILLRNGEKIDERFFYLNNETFDYLRYDSNGWFLSSSINLIKILLSELESVLEGGSDLHICKHCGLETTQPDEECYMVKEIIELKSKKKSSIEWLVSILNKPGFAPVLTDEEIQQAKQMHREESINFHIEVMKSGLLHEGEEKWTNGYLPKIKDMAEKTYNETFKND